MLFTSFAYLVFLPVVFGLYWLMGRSTRAQNWLLLVASYVFYGWWDAKLLLLILGMTAVTFGAAAVIGASRRPAIRRTVCGAAVVVCLGVLVVFKYFDFFARSMAEALRAFGMDCDMVTFRLILPAGISFYTFQSLSYVIDVYRGSMRPTRDFVCYAVFIAFFPQLVAGPIERASRMIPIFSSPRTFCYAQAVEGLRRILIGLLKKMVIADNISESVTAIFSDYQGQSSAVLAFGAVAFTVEIYCDFSGYSDIAIGSAKLLGIELSENFKAPLFASSIRDFWRRWHITLMNWFRDYLYIPLGGGRAHKTRNTFVVFALSGLWHGANWTFVAWGLYNALLFAPFRRIERRQWPVAVMRVLTFVCVVVGFIFFRSADIGAAFGYIGRMLAFSGGALVPPAATHALVAVVAAALLMAAEYKALPDGGVTRLLCMMPRWARRTAYIMIALVIFTLGGEPTAFIYFQF